MSPVLAQAAPDPDLTRPIMVIAVCAVIIIVTVFLQVAQARRRAHALTPEALHDWQTSSGRLLDLWIDAVEGELRARRSAPDPNAVAPATDPPGFAEAAAACPDPALSARIADLRAQAATLLATARGGDPNRPEVAAAEAAYLEAKARAGAHLRDAFSPQPAQ